MRISFDLDDVLFVAPERYETEPPPRFPFNRIFVERLRKGTVWLIHELQRQGFEVWAYTSSFRSVMYIKKLFWLYGVRFQGIINASRHLAEVQKSHRHVLPQKMPQYYRISLHIDDDPAILANARTYGFHALKVFEPDDEWTDKVLAEANRIRKLEEDRDR